jgi:hypothetical protein
MHCIYDLYEGSKNPTVLMVTLGRLQDFIHRSEINAPRSLTERVALATCLIANTEESQRFA